MESADFRRFYYVVVEKIPVSNGMATVVVGMVHGRIETEDNIYILQPNGTVLQATVDGMESKIESYMMKIQTAEDMQVNIFLRIRPENIQKFSVITSIKPQFETDVNEAVENPAVAALLYGKRLFANEEYFEWLCYSLAHAHFITPVQLSRQPRDNRDGTATFEADSSLSFYMLADPNDKKTAILPVFTDWNELSKWKQLAEGGKVQTIILRFADIAAITDRPDCGGFVVNPYSENQSLINKDIIRAITGSEGYQREFSSDGPKEYVAEEHIKENTKIVVGVPAPSREVDMIRGELSLYGKKNPDVKAIYLMRRMDSDGTKSYIVILDADEREYKAHFAKIYEVVKHYAVETPLVNFIPQGHVEAIDALLDEKTLVYSK